MKFENFTNEVVAVSNPSLTNTASPNSPSAPSSEASATPTDADSPDFEIAINDAEFERLLKLEPGEFSIQTDEHGVITASALGQNVTCHPHFKGARIFHRNGIKLVPCKGQVRSRWLVIEHAGTRIYINGPQIVVTHKDLYP